MPTIARLMTITLLSCTVYLFSSVSVAQMNDLFRLHQAYPEQIIAISLHQITWADGTTMPVDDNKSDKTQQEKLDNPCLLDQLLDVHYTPGVPRYPEYFAPASDPGRIRYTPFFLKMYGETEQAVMQHLVTIYWMPAVFGDAYPIEVTRVNHVDKKLIHISDELEILVQQHPEFIPFLENPGGTFKWRFIANTNRLSAHSFGMTIDINSNKADYWQWELIHAELPIDENAPLIYRNNIPWEIIPIFEKYGFIWGGKWYHYDSMHFEYRPELLL